MSNDLLQANLTRLAGADVPFRAWAVSALLSTRGGSLASIGKEIATELSDDAARLESPDHADIAGFAALAPTGFLRPEQVQRVLAAVPPPHADLRIRSKFFASSAYVYLLARGLGREYEHRTELSGLIEQQIEDSTAQAEPDLVDLLLALAARLELGAQGVHDATFRRVAGRVTAAGKSPSNVLACRWFLELYGDELRGGDARALVASLREFVQGAGAPISADDERPSTLAMSIELLARKEPRYQLVSEADNAQVIAARLGKRRWTEGIAYLVAIVAVVGVPIWRVAVAKTLPPGLAWLAAVSLAVPLIVFATRLVLGKPPQWSLFGPAIMIGAGYYGAAMYAAFVDRTIVQRLMTEGVVLAALPVLLAGIWAPVRDATAAR